MEILLPTFWFQTSGGVVFGVGWGGGVGGGINQAFVVSAVFTVSLGCMYKSRIYPTLYFKLDKMHS